MSQNLVCASLINTNLQSGQSSSTAYREIDNPGVTNEVVCASNGSIHTKKLKDSSNGTKFSNHLRRLIRSSSRKQSKDQRTIGEDEDRGTANVISVQENNPSGNQSPIQSIQGTNDNYDTLPPLPLSNEPITESLIAQAEMNHVGQRGHNKAAPRTFHGTVSHLRNPRHASARATEPEPHASPYYPHQHLTLVERYALRGLQHGELRRRLEKTEEKAEEEIKSHSSGHQSPSKPTMIEELRIQMTDVSVSGPSSLVENVTPPVSQMTKSAARESLSATESVSAFALGWVDEWAI
ncbi:hypothetical protein FBUS_00036 [Fasciolopsis buskii]|uniref:Uncharacterized protein n=1 Tax=Fasciolopsis buskii TaxID=27845 RepID=A0A8E0RZ04_9TREM|nr:hypothetical protein FBUS_00036 [Fasciolopsis buski]